MSNNRKIATVNDIAEIMLELSKQGLGEYKVKCNDEYWLAMKGDKADLNHNEKFINLGGYDGWTN